jgi:chromosome partitioning protein
MSKKPSIICIANQKGGVAKTTTVVNLAASFASLGKSVLVIDTDYQGNATDILGIKIADADKKNLATAILKEMSGEEVILKSPTVQNVDIIAGTRELSDVVTQMTGQVHQHLLLKPILSDTVLDQYDIIIIDTHPTLDCLYMSAMASAHYYLMPVFPDPESAKGIVDMVHSAEKIRKYLNPLLFNLGAVICRYDKSFATHPKFVEKIRELSKAANFPVCETLIPNSASISAASVASQPVVSWKPNAVISLAYCALAGELFNQLKGKRMGRVPVPNMEAVTNMPREFEASVEF